MLLFSFCLKLLWCFDHSSLFFLYFWNLTHFHFLSSSVLPTLIFPCFFLSFISLSLFLSLFLPGPGHWCGGLHEHLRPDPFPFWRVGAAPPPPLPFCSHSGLSHHDTHCGVPDCVPQRPAPALVADAVVPDERRHSGLMSLDTFLRLLWKRVQLPLHSTNRARHHH